LFPMTFWSETAMAVGAVTLAVALVTMWRARRNTASPNASPVLTTSRARP
jgi:hypothetical protein